MATVTTERCSSYEYDAVLAAVRRSLAPLGGISNFVRSGERILLKPNLLIAKDVTSAVTTHPAIVKATIELVREAGGEPVVGDSPAFGSARKVAAKCGILDVCDETGTELIELRTKVVIDNPGGITFKRLELAEEALAADGIINLPKLKTHGQMYLTLAVKNLFGCVPGGLKPQLHLSAGTDTSAFAAMLLDVCYHMAPRLSVMDGIVAMEGNGPGAGTAKEVGLIFASDDPLAMDAIVTDIIGARAEDSPVLKRALAEGSERLAAANMDGIVVAGEAAENVRVTGFEFPPMINVNFASHLPAFLDKRVRKATTSRPHIEPEACTLCSNCVEQCPAEVMEKTVVKPRAGGEIILIDYDGCIRCYCCQEVCPEGAISVKEGWLKRLASALPF